MTTTAHARMQFDVPASRMATGPSEQRRLSRDQVRLMVAQPDSLQHTRFLDLPQYLRSGDLLVINTSATRPAALDGRLQTKPVVIHLAVERPTGGWVVEVRRADGTGPVLDAPAGAQLDADGDMNVTLVKPYGQSSQAGVRLWLADVKVPAGSVSAHMRTHGRPITYGSPTTRFSLDAYQTIFADTEVDMGSAEMASAARPFSQRLLTALVRRGIIVAPVTLHAGVSSPELHEPPLDEWFMVPPVTASLVTHSRRNGRRVIAVGTIVVRALESVASADGTVRPGSGWTNLVLGPDRGARVVNGLITGWHEAQASHLLLLEAVAGTRLVERTYAAALEGEYLWHEFGDSCLLLPPSRTTTG